MNIKNITIIGTGNLGSRIGLQAAISEYNVIFYDITDSALSTAKKKPLKKSALNSLNQT